MNDRPIKYSITNDSVTVFVDGKDTTVQRGRPNFTSLCTFLLEGNWAHAHKHLSVAGSLLAWAKGRFTYEAGPDLSCPGQLLFDGRPVPEVICVRALKMAGAGESPDPLFRFWERLAQNPSYNSVQQLWPFLQHAGIPLTDDGHFLAYKGVNANFTDCYSATIDNTPGVHNSMDRNLVSDDPAVPCHAGFHVGAESYALGMTPHASQSRRPLKVVICKVDPKDVVCVPRDYSYMKMRVCAYAVVGMRGETMPSTSIRSEDVPQPTSEKDWIRSKLELDQLVCPTSTTVHQKECAADRALTCVPPPGPCNCGLASRPAGLGEEMVGPSEKCNLGQPRPKVPAKYRRHADMTPAQLMELPLERLRELATHCFRIVGASKVPGGKSALVDRIIKARS